MITSYSRGHPIYYDGSKWRYIDNNEVERDDRPCARCGKKSTFEGYDACLGYIHGAKSACCGHGASETYVMMGTGGF
jgi:hypothetical protein